MNETFRHIYGNFLYFKAHLVKADKKCEIYYSSLGSEYDFYYFEGLTIIPSRKSVKLLLKYGIFKDLSEFLK